MVAPYMGLACRKEEMDPDKLYCKLLLALHKEARCSTPVKRNQWGDVSTLFAPFDEDEEPTDLPPPKEIFPSFSQDLFVVNERKIELYYAGLGLHQETTLYHVMYRLRDMDVSKCRR